MLPEIGLEIVEVLRWCIMMELQMLKSGVNKDQR